MTRLKLYPGHTHDWQEDLLGGKLLTCTVCGLQMPRVVVEPYLPPDLLAEPDSSSATTLQISRKSANPHDHAYP